MSGLVAEHRGEQVRCAVGHGRLTVEAVGRRDLTLDTDDVRQAIEPARMLVDPREHVQRRELRRLPPVIDARPFAHAIRISELAVDEQQVPETNSRLPASLTAV